MMTRIEVLFPEFCSLFADSSNVRYLERCLPDAEFVYTSYMDEPLFVTEKPDLIYMGAMTESAQEKIIKKLMPYKERIAQLISEDVPMLFTNNAVEIFGQYIENEDGSKIEALNLYPIYAKRDMMHRFNCLLRGSFDDIQIVGNDGSISIHRTRHNVGIDIRHLDGLTDLDQRVLQNVAVVLIQLEHAAAQHLFHRNLVALE